MRTIFFAIAAILLFTSHLASQVAEYPLEKFGEVDLTVEQSTLPRETVLAINGRARWERLSRFDRSTDERKLSRPVGRLQIKNSNSFWVCSGFLVSENLLLTNHHCTGTSKGADEIVLQMGYYNRLRLGGFKQYPVVVQPLAENADLDFALMEVVGKPGEDWGTVKLLKTIPREGARLAVVHHPAGDIKRITQSGCVAGPRSEGKPSSIAHECDTVEGSSGGAVFERTGGVVALHYGGAIIRGPGAYNFATLIEALEPYLEEFGIPVLRDFAALSPRANSVAAIESLGETAPQIGWHESFAALEGVYPSAAFEFRPQHTIDLLSDATVVRSDDECQSMQWVFRHNGQVKLQRNALSELRYRYFVTAPGDYTVHLACFLDGRYKVVSNVLSYSR